MSRARPPFRNVFFFLSALAASGLAGAHTGHDSAASLMDGLLHPFGMDHLLAMLAVGIWSAKALPQRQSWQGPAVFLGALLFGALLGQQGLVMRFTEAAIALSVVVFGLMLLLPTARVGRVQGLFWVAVAALLHGFAHGAESPAGGFAGFIVGMLLSTTCLHLLGLTLGLGIQRFVHSRQNIVFQASGLALALAGVYAFAQV